MQINCGYNQLVEYFDKGLVKYKARKLVLMIILFFSDKIKNKPSGVKDNFQRIEKEQTNKFVEMPLMILYLNYYITL